MWPAWRLSWRPPGPSGQTSLLTLNLSPRTLEVRDFDAGWLLQGLYRNGISPGRVILELTERDEIADLVRLQRTFSYLQQYGLRLAADDVGAGNSGLRLLSQVQFDIVKIDLSLVHDGARRLGARAVLRSLRDLALSQNAHVVAEGVETREQLQVIRELDIGAGQGYLLGRPDASVQATFVDFLHLGSDPLIPSVLVPAPAVAATIDAAEAGRVYEPAERAGSAGNPAAVFGVGPPLHRPAASTSGWPVGGRSGHRLRGCRPRCWPLRSDAEPGAGAFVQGALQCGRGSTVSDDGPLGA